MSNAPLRIVAAWSAFGALATLAACSPNHIDARELATEQQSIIDGQQADASELGATVAVADEIVGQLCGGVLIAPQVVVTAAHCLLWDDNFDFTDVEVYAGETDLDNVDASETYSATAIIPHPDFTWDGNPSNDADDLGNDSDIGIILLSAPVQGVTPEPLLPATEIDNALVPDVTPLSILGWGATNDNMTGFADDIRIASTTFRRHSTFELIAGGNNQPDGCAGDSGGPAWVWRSGTRYLAGLVSRAQAGVNDPCGDGGIYTIPAAFEDWIVSVSQGLYQKASTDPVTTEPDPDAVDPYSDTCAGRCGEVGVDDTCFCDESCAALGDCCADYESECTEPAPTEPAPTEPPPTEEPVTDEPVDDTTTDDTTEPADEQLPAPDGWLCQPNYYDDDLCDCGCGVVDVDCESDSAVMCEFVACEGGLTVLGDSTACPGDYLQDPNRQEDVNTTPTGEDGFVNNGGDTGATASDDTGSESPAPSGGGSGVIPQGPTDTVPSGSDTNPYDDPDIRGGMACASTSGSTGADFFTLFAPIAALGFARRSSKGDCAPSRARE